MAAAGGEAARRCLFDDLRRGEGGFTWDWVSNDWSRREEALRFCGRDGAEPAAGIKDEGPELADWGDSAASLAAERVTLEDMRT